MVQIFSPYVELLRKRFPASLAQIKEAGFDGVECHLIGGLRSSRNIRDVREEVASLGLDIRFHQGWSWESGQRNLHNVILRPLGALVPVGMSLTEQVRDVGTDPVVIYGNHGRGPRRENYLYQTSSEYVHGKVSAMSFSDYVSAVKSSGLPVVFDTQHVLEWSLDTENVAGLPTSPATLKKLVEELWEELHPYVREIHLCDFDPSLGGSYGRNVFLGNGVFPLTEFATVVRASGWSGVITPEVSFQYLHGHKLRAVREKVDQLFR